MDRIDAIKKDATMQVDREFLYHVECELLMELDNIKQFKMTLKEGVNGF